MIYRPPNSDVEQFTSLLSGVLDTVKRENKIYYLLGDYNINILNINKHISSSEFIENFYSYEYVPFINKPTRDIGSSTTLIDNI